MAIPWRPGGGPAGLPVPPVATVPPVVPPVVTAPPVAGGGSTAGGGGFMQYLLGLFGQGGATPRVPEFGQSALPSGRPNASWAWQRQAQANAARAAAAAAAATAAGTAPPAAVPAVPATPVVAGTVSNPRFPMLTALQDGTLDQLIQAGRVPVPRPVAPPVVGPTGGSDGSQLMSLLASLGRR